MDIDNSKADAFRFCPWGYYEKYVRNGTGVEPKRDEQESLIFGDRMHQLLQEYYLEKAGIYEAHFNKEIENEAQTMYAAYKTYYGWEKLNIQDVERVFKVQLPDFCPECYKLDVISYLHSSDIMRCKECECFFRQGRHNLVGKIDLTYLTDSNKLNIMDHKTQLRASKSNLPQKWGAKDQASLYLWAARRVYSNFEIGDFIVNILTRESEKGQIGPTFPERYVLSRSEKEIECAIRDIAVVADEIERYTRVFGDREWPANRENCYGFYYCPYYQLHRYGEDVETILQHNYQPKKEYLNLAGLPVIQ